jgi:hypothetical protein
MKRKPRDWIMENVSLHDNLLSRLHVKIPTTSPMILSVPAKTSTPVRIRSLWLPKWQDLITSIALCG